MYFAKKINKQVQKYYALGIKLQINKMSELTCSQPQHTSRVELTQEHYYTFSVTNIKVGLMDIDPSYLQYLPM